MKLKIYYRSKSWIRNLQFGKGQFSYDLPSRDDQSGLWAHSKLKSFSFLEIFSLANPQGSIFWTFYPVHAWFLSPGKSTLQEVKTLSREPRTRKCPQSEETKKDSTESPDNLKCQVLELPYVAFKK